MSEEHLGLERNIYVSKQAREGYDLSRDFEDPVRVLSK